MIYLVLLILFIIVMKSFFRVNINSDREHSKTFGSFNKSGNEIEDADFEEVD